MRPSSKVCVPSSGDQSTVASRKADLSCCTEPALDHDLQSAVAHLPRQGLLPTVRRDPRDPEASHGPEPWSRVDADPFCRGFVVAASNASIGPESFPETESTGMHAPPLGLPTSRCQIRTSPRGSHADQVIQETHHKLLEIVPHERQGIQVVIKREQ